MISLFTTLFYFAALLVFIAGAWQVYAKAGKPGWASIVPFYNTYVLFEIGGRPGWWMIFLFIPVANVIFAIIALHNLSKSFGHGVGFTLGLIFLPPIFFCILGFGPETYLGPQP